MNCFFKKVKPADAQIIKGFEDLRWDDQEKLRQKVDGKSIKESSKIKSNVSFSQFNTKNYFVLDDKSDEIEDDSSNYSAEYARSNRSTCHGCNLKIEKDHVRLSRKVTTNRNHPPTDQWYHIDCFKDNKDKLHFHGTAETFVYFI